MYSELEWLLKRLSEVVSSIGTRGLKLGGQPHVLSMGAPSWAVLVFLFVIALQFTP